MLRPQGVVSCNFKVDNLADVTSALSEEERAQVLSVSCAILRKRMIMKTLAFTRMMRKLTITMMVTVVALQVLSMTMTTLVKVAMAMGSEGWGGQAWRICG